MKSISSPVSRNWPPTHIHFSWLPCCTPTHDTTTSPHRLDQGWYWTQRVLWLIGGQSDGLCTEWLARGQSGTPLNCKVIQLRVQQPLWKSTPTPCQTQERLSSEQSQMATSYREKGRIILMYWKNPTKAHKIQGEKGKERVSNRPKVTHSI